MKITLHSIYAMAKSGWLFKTDYLITIICKNAPKRDMKANDGHMNDEDFSTWIQSWFLSLWFIFYRYSVQQKVQDL